MCPDLKGATLSGMTLIVGTPDIVVLLGFALVVGFFAIILAAAIKYLRKK